MSGSLCCSQIPPFLSWSKPRKDASVIAWKLYGGKCKTHCGFEIYLIDISAI